MRVGALVGMASAVTAVGGDGARRSGCLRYTCPKRRGGRSGWRFHCGRTLSTGAGSSGVGARAGGQVVAR